ncbi:hypothetical protein ACFW04_013759 [Cataglyphis niger]
MGTSRFINAIDLSRLPEIRVDWSKIEYSTCIKYLGVTIMNTLSWEKQVTNMTNRIHSTLYQVKLCRHLLPETLKSNVVTLIYPHVDYYCVSYTYMTTEHNLRLHKTTNACIRFIFNVSTYDEHITPYYVRLRWLKVARRAYFVGCLLYKILETKQPSLLHSNFNCRVTTDRRNRINVRLTSARFWNGLSQSIRSATTLADFKQILYSHLLDCAFL